MEFPNESSKNEINFLNESDINQSLKEENKNVNELMGKYSFSSNNESNNSDKDKKIKEMGKIIYLRKNNSFPLYFKDPYHLEKIKIGNKKSLSDNDKNNIKSETSFGISSVEKKKQKSKNSTVHCKKFNLIIFYRF